MEVLRRGLRSNRIFNFNQVERDRWVEYQASQVAAASRVLDVGAGSAPYRHLFAHCEYHTHDFSKLKDDQLRGKSGYEQITYESDIVSIPVPDDSYDVILCTEVIEHVPEPIAAIEEMRRILRPGGRLILSAPLGSGIHQSPYHYYGGYTPYWYQRFLDGAGFENVSINPNGGFFKHYGQESIRFWRMLSPRNLSTNRLVQLAWAPCWALLGGWFAVACPVTCHFADSLDKEKGFTIGYHVLAEKRAV